ncbi:protein IQ-DOMAIN 14-like isoform X2 [Neltuma alba]|uniref:protein IQ-DOMAIN 14-like isoform X2 n=1 Tax=Neltuma alba TaxID=207710 RepID=UPI0010A3CDC0|nr:protein IQ-DOMAIN 14-like isoform X2 [Prosopis alba]
MGKTRKWLRNLLMSRKKHKDKAKRECEASQIASSDASQIPTPKEKRRWSFRRPSDSKQLNSAETNVTASPTPPPPPEATSDTDQNLQNNHFAIVTTHNITVPSTEDDAAIRIQSVFRSYLARKALSALRGIVKLQALVRGHLVRKQASAALRCMEALLTAQARAWAQRNRMTSEAKSNQRHLNHPRKTQESLIRPVYDYDETDMESQENIRIVKVDVSGSKDNGRSRNNTINYTHYNSSEHSFSTYYHPHGSYSKEENLKVSPVPSAQSSPASSKPDDKKLPFTSPGTSHNPSVPNYMAYTESSRAKFRSHSAPKQRPDTLERQLSRPRASVEARNTGHRPVMKMRRSSSHVNSSAQHYQFPSTIKLDRSAISLIESECGSSSTVLTNTQYCRSLVSYDPHEDRCY